MSTARMYFIAIVAPPEINEVVLKWKHYVRDHYGCTVALRSPAHITLIPPFWMQELQEPGLVQDTHSFAAGQQMFEITLQGFDAFRPRVIFVAVQENGMLNTLKAGLEQFLVSLNKYPVKKETRPFHPHLTIANRDLRKKDFTPAFEHFSKIDYEASFPVQDIALMKHNGTAWSIAQRWLFVPGNI